MTLREWLSAQMDNLGATIFIAILVAALIGFIKRSTGAAVFIACSCSATLVLILFPWVSDWGYSWQKVVPVLGVGSGFLALGLFSIAMKMADRLQARDVEIADKLINKGVNLIPGSDRKE